MVFPGSHWKFQRAAGQGLWTCARPAACLGAGLSSPRESGSGKLLDFLVASTLARKRNPSPALPGRRNPESGCWELGFRTPGVYTHTLPPGYCELSQPGSQAAVDDGVFLWDIRPRTSVLLLCPCQPWGQGTEKRERQRGLLRAGARLEACRLQPTQVMDSLHGEV